MKNEHTYIVYTVECKDWSYNIGITYNLEKDYGNIIQANMKILTLILAGLLN